MDFEGVGSIPDGEEIELDECGDEYDECQQEKEQHQQQCDEIRSSSPALSSASLSSMYSIDEFLKCKVCNQRKKNRIMQCSHSICDVCFDAIKEERINECATIRSRVIKKRDEQMLKCPFDVCGKAINDQVTEMCLDF